jgi:hypothetical protein
VRRPLLSLNVLLAFLSAPALAQPAGGVIGALEGDLDPDLVSRARALAADEALSAADVEALFAAAGQRINPREGATLLAVLDGKVPGIAADAVSAEARAKALELAVTKDLFPASAGAVAAGRTYAGTEAPLSVREVLARARLNGAVAFDPAETNEEGEGVYTDYPSITPASENMRFAWTEVTPAALKADLEDTRPRLVIRGSASVDVNGDQVSVARYEVAEKGTGSISSAYDEVFHPVRSFSEATRVRLQYPDWMSAWKVDAIREARSSSGDRWASNCAILSDGSIHCLPAVRRHSAHPNLILTNPALARGHQLLWNGHLTARAGVITSVGTSGRISRRAAEGRDRFVNPLPLLRAWGFELAPGLEVRSEHATARYLQDDEACVLRELPAPAPPE